MDKLTFIFWFAKSIIINNTMFEDNIEKGLFTFYWEQDKN